MGPTEVAVSCQWALRLPRCFAFGHVCICRVTVSDSVSASGRSAHSLPYSSASVTAVVASARRPSSIQDAHCNLRAKLLRKVRLLLNGPTAVPSQRHSRSQSTIQSCSALRVVGRTNPMVIAGAAGTASGSHWQVSIAHDGGIDATACWSMHASGACAREPR